MYRSPRNYSQRTGGRGQRAYFLTAEMVPVSCWSEGAAFQVNAMSLAAAIAAAKAGRVVRSRA